MTPSLTTVHLPATELGRAAGEMLFQLIRRQQPANLRTRLSTHLVIRKSCGAG
jgi:DNA-binding LacI/PurR family transcriptional regulator